VAAGLLQYPVTDLTDQSVSLGERDEFSRRNHAKLGMMPTDQCLKRRYVARVAGLDRLVDDTEFLVFDGSQKLALAPSRRAGVCIFGRVVERIFAASVTLCLVEGDIGRLQDIVSSRAVARRPCDTNAHTHADRPAVDIERLPDLIENTLGNRRSVV